MAVKSFLSVFFVSLMLLSTIHCVTISVTNGASEGRWGAKESCPAGSKAIAYDTANDFSDVPRIDKTALNSIRLHCNDPEGSMITSSIGEQVTSFGLRYECPAGAFLTSFRLRVQPIDTSDGVDNTAANNIHFRCSDGLEMNGYGNSGGDWGDWSDECNQGICGMETRVKPAGTLPTSDDTALNDVRFECC